MKLTGPEPKLGGQGPENHRQQNDRYQNQGRFFQAVNFYHGLPVDIYICWNCYGFWGVW